MSIWYKKEFGVSLELGGEQERVACEILNGCSHFKAHCLHAAASLGLLGSQKWIL